jgi:hypothetical protein
MHTGPVAATQKADPSPNTAIVATIDHGTAIVFDRMRVGFSVPEARENGKGIRGGRPWYQAANVHQAQHGRQAKADQAT